MRKEDALRRIQEDMRIIREYRNAKSVFVPFLPSFLDAERRIGEYLKAAQSVVDSLKQLEQTPVAGGEEAPSEDPGVCELKCPVCLDGISSIKSSGRSVMSTVCGHIFCSSCLPDCIRNNHCCPTCRKRLSESDIHPIFI